MICTTWKALPFVWFLYHGGFNLSYLKMNHKKNLFKTWCTWCLMVIILNTMTDEDLVTLAICTVSHISTIVSASEVSW